MRGGCKYSVTVSNNLHSLLSVTTTLNLSALSNSNFKIVADIIVRDVADTYIVRDAQISIL